MSIRWVRLWVIPTEEISLGWKVTQQQDCNAKDKRCVIGAYHYFSSSSRPTSANRFEIECFIDRSTAAQWRPPVEMISKQCIFMLPQGLYHRSENTFNGATDWLTTLRDDWSTGVRFVYLSRELIDLDDDGNYFDLIRSRKSRLGKASFWLSSVCSIRSDYIDACFTRCGFLSTLPKKQLEKIPFSNR